MRGMHQPFHHARGSHHDERTHLHQNPRAQNAVPPADQETEEEEEMHAPVQDGRGEHRRGVHVHRGVAVWDAASVFNLQWACTLYSCCKMMLMLIVNIFLFDRTLLRKVGIVSVSMETITVLVSLVGCYQANGNQYRTPLNRTGNKIRDIKEFGSQWYLNKLLYFQQGKCIGIESFVKTNVFFFWRSNNFLYAVLYIFYNLNDYKNALS